MYGLDFTSIFTHYSSQKQRQKGTTPRPAKQQTQVQVYAVVIHLWKDVKFYWDTYFRLSGGAGMKQGAQQLFHEFEAILTAEIELELIADGGLSKDISSELKIKWEEIVEANGGFSRDQKKHKRLSALLRQFEWAQAWYEGMYGDSTAEEWGRQKR